MNNIEFKYLNITEDDADFGLWVSTVGFQSIEPGMTYPIKSHPTGYYFNPEKGRTLNKFQFIFISKGEGVFSAQHYDNMKVTKGNLLMIFRVNGIHIILRWKRDGTSSISASEAPQSRS